MRRGSLGADLAEMERTDPAVAAAAANLDRMAADATAAVTRVARHLCDIEHGAGNYDLTSPTSRLVRAKWGALARAAIELGADPTRVP